MAKHSEFIQFLLEILGPLGDISACPMFGGYAIRKKRFPFALVMDDRVYFKVDDSNRKDYERAGSKPFTYMARGKEIVVSNWEVPVDILEDDDKLLKWAEKSYDISVTAKAKKRSKLS